MSCLRSLHLRITPSWTTRTSYLPRTPPSTPWKPKRKCEARPPETWWPGPRKDVRCTRSSKVGGASERQSAGQGRRLRQDGATAGGPVGESQVGKEEINVSAEENEAVVRREQVELWNHTGNLDAAQELFAPDYVEAAKQEAADFRRGFPDVISTIEDLIAEGNKIVARWRSRATHQGDYMGIAPTGKEVQFMGISLYRIEEGKIAESWTVEDQFGLMRQIGAIREPGQAQGA